MDSARARRMQENRKLLISICKVVVLCARQSIALRGHREDEDSENKGNFLEILSIVASESPALKSHIDNCAGNAKYLSKTTQNELLQAASDVCKQISEEVKVCGFFSVIADEAPDKSRVEQLSLCLRYVHVIVL